MTRTEVVELVDLIQVHRPYFRSRIGDKIYKDLLNEWTTLLDPYDYEDVKENLTAFLKDESNFGREPDVYQLMRGLYTSKEKEEGSKGQVACQFCGRYMNRIELGHHEDRCRSIRYLKKIYQRYMNNDLNVSKELYDMDDKNFNEKYIAVLEKALPRMTDPIEIRGVTNVIETYYGRPPVYSVNEL